MKSFFFLKKNEKQKNKLSINQAVRLFEQQLRMFCLINLIILSYLSCPATYQVNFIYSTITNALIFFVNFLLYDHISKKNEISITIL